MKFAEIEANDGLCSALAGMVGSGKIPHAVLLHDSDGGQGVAVAIAFLQYLYCESPSPDDSCGLCPSCNRVSKFIHSDVHPVFPLTSGNTSRDFLDRWRELVLGNPCFTEEDFNEAMGIEGKSSVIAVPQAREILDVLSLSALEGGYRSILIYLPEKMNQEAANRLLKIIEEPPQKTQFVLVTHAPEKVLPTIASRCQRLRVLPSGKNVGKTNESYAELLKDLLDALEARDLCAALDAADCISALGSRENAKAFCKFAAESLRNVFVIQQGLDDIAVNPCEEQYRWASGFRKTFAREALSSFSRAENLIERNVNLKIIFTELAGKLYIKR